MISLTAHHTRANHGHGLSRTSPTSADREKDMEHFPESARNEVN